MSDIPSYKESLHLPKTSFPMKANLPVREPEILKQWHDSSIYEKMSGNSGEVFSFPDGPPYANGNIHTGHALNKILKDIIIKYKNMSGKKAIFIPGWDCHGLPIELEVNKKLGSKRKNISDSEFRKSCKDYALQQVGKQKEQFQRLGILADWENSYLTLHASYEAEEVRQLAKLVESENFYLGEKPVYWCWPLQTALADTEVEYHEHTSPSVYVKFPTVKDNSLFKSIDQTVSFLIWTTTPWTIPANLAIALNENFVYRVYSCEGDYILFAEELLESLQNETGLEFKSTDLSFKGSELEGLVAKHPWIDRESKIILGSHVSLEAGTGCVHTAPGHGADDYIVGQKYNLDIYSPVDESGKYTDQVPEFEGINVFEANPKVIEKLESVGKLLFKKSITHSYPHCWRTKKPLIFRATSQWFLKMDGDKNNIRQKSLDAIENIVWTPAWGKNRITSMVENRPDWCLSRQRLWGVPIPVFKCNNCSDFLVDANLMRSIADKMENGEGINTYFDSPTTDLTQGYSCKSCGSKDFQKSKDILDVWFDSGVCHSAVQRKNDYLPAPADIYLEGSDQHRGWFQTSLLSSIAAYGEAPFKQVITHGFVNDINGKKMSKSLGNVVDPKDVIGKYGAEILRLWSVYEDYGQDLTCGDESFKRLSETYRRIRNTMRFFIGNLDGFNPDQIVDYQKLEALDKFALNKLLLLTQQVQSHYENYEFYKIYHTVNNFFTVDLSAVYLDILKDRLYADTASSRAAAQTTLYYLVQNLCKLLAPILSFLAEEVYAYLPGSKQESIFLEKFPQLPDQWNDEQLLSDFECILEYRAKASKELENLRNKKVIGSSLEASVQLTCNKKDYAILKNYEENLADYFIVSNLELKQGDEKLLVEKAKGEKCARCWKFNENLGSSSKLPGICPRCTEALG